MTRLVVYEPESPARTRLCDQLRRAGCSVASFADARNAFLFMLGRAHEIDGVIVNIGDAARGRWLANRIGMLACLLPIVTYRDGDTASAAWIDGSPTDECGS